MTFLPKHLEKYLGPINSRLITSSKLQIIRYEPREDFSAYSTLGLSHHTLEARYGQDNFPRTELLMISDGKANESFIIDLLDFVSNQMLLDHGSLYQGLVIPFGKFPDSYNEDSPSSLYVTLPSYFPEDFYSCSDDKGEISILWLIPVTDNEVKFLKDKGWSEFEKEITRLKPNFKKYNRTSFLEGKNHGVEQ